MKAQWVWETLPDSNNLKSGFSVTSIIFNRLNKCQGDQQLIWNKKRENL